MHVRCLCAGCLKRFSCVCVDMRGGNLDDVENEVGRVVFVVWKPKNYVRKKNSLIMYNGVVGFCWVSGL